MSAGTRETDYLGGGGSNSNTGMTDFPTAGATPPGGAGRQSQQFGGGEQNPQQVLHLSLYDEERSRILK